MASAARSIVRRRLGVLIAGAAVVTSLTPAAATAAPTPLGAPAGIPLRGASLASGSMGGNDPELGSRRTARPPAAPAGGFVYRNGRYTPLDTVDSLITAHVAINNRGQTAGSYWQSELDPGGFVRSRGGDYIRVDVAPGPSTLLLDLNDRGAILGWSGDAVTGQARGFLRRPNGEVTAIEVPGAQLTAPMGVNNRGVVVGGYNDAGGVLQAFVLQRGTVTTIVHPDAPADPAAAQTVATDLNDRGQVVGCFADANGTYHGFRYDQGRFTRIDPPGGADVPNYATTCPFGINNRGQVVGQYVDAAGELHSYLWEPGRGLRPSILLAGRAASARRCLTGTESAEPWPPTSTTAGRSSYRPRVVSSSSGRRAFRRASAAKATWPRRRPPPPAKPRSAGSGHRKLPLPLTTPRGSGAAAFLADLRSAPPAAAIRTGLVATQGACAGRACRSNPDRPEPAVAANT
jgi:probable HAF family extracellular repeat protein